MQFVNLDQQIFVPVVDETHGGATYEMKMTVGEFFAKCCGGFAPEAVEAIPVEWLEDKELYYRTTGDKMFSDAFAVVIGEWQNEQEAQD